jgi:Protein of unknown function VcgC/VcgE (DUF2780)
MRTLALTLAIPAALAYAQSNPAPAPQQPEASQPAPSAEKSVDQTASPELVGQLVNELGITPTQAQGAAGTLFGVAKTKLSAADFAKVASAVPNMEGLLKAAPAADSKSAATDLVAGAAGLGAGSAAAAAGALSKLGLKTDTIVKLTPALVKAVQSKGGAEVGTLLATALK